MENDAVGGSSILPGIPLFPVFRDGEAGTFGNRAVYDFTKPEGQARRVKEDGSYVFQPEVRRILSKEYQQPKTEDKKGKKKKK